VPHWTALHEDEMSALNTLVDDRNVVFILDKASIEFPEGVTPSSTKY
jgi:hypothetical protein